MDGCQQMISGKWKIRINSEEDGGDLYLVNGSMTKLADAGAFAGKAGGNMPQV